MSTRSTVKCRTWIQSLAKSSVCVHVDQIKQYFWIVNRPSLRLIQAFCWIIDRNSHKFNLSITCTPHSPPRFWKSQKADDLIKCIRLHDILRLNYKLKWMLKAFSNRDQNNYLIERHLNVADSKNLHSQKTQQTLDGRLPFKVPRII